MSQSEAKMLLFRSKKTLRKQRSSSSLNNLNTLPNISFAGTAVNFLIFVYFLKHTIKLTKESAGTQIWILMMRWTKFTSTRYSVHTDSLISFSLIALKIIQLNEKNSSIVKENGVPWWYSFTVKVNFINLKYIYFVGGRTCKCQSYGTSAFWIYAHFQ